MIRIVDNNFIKMCKWSYEDRERDINRLIIEASLAHIIREKIREKNTYDCIVSNCYNHIANGVINHVMLFVCLRLISQLSSLYAQNVPNYMSGVYFIGLLYALFSYLH